MIRKFILLLLCFYNVNLHCTRIKMGPIDLVNYYEKNDKFFDKEFVENFPRLLDYIEIFEFIESVKGINHLYSLINEDIRQNHMLCRIFDFLRMTDKKLNKKLVYLFYKIKTLFADEAKADKLIACFSRVLCYYSIITEKKLKKLKSEGYKKYIFRYV